jgi:hypothetical protein
MFLEIMKIFSLYLCEELLKKFLQVIKIFLIVQSIPLSTIEFFLCILYSSAVASVHYFINHKVFPLHLRLTFGLSREKCHKFKTYNVLYIYFMVKELLWLWSKTSQLFVNNDSHYLRICQLSSDPLFVIFYP